jgi:ATP-binding cassette subfamily F protein uup
LRQRGSASVAVAPKAPAREVLAAPRAPKAQSKLSYKDQRELNDLPGKMEALSAEIAALEAKLADAGFYGRDPEGFAKQTARLTLALGERDQAEERWLELEMLKEQVGG